MIISAFLLVVVVGCWFLIGRYSSRHQYEDGQRSYSPYSNLKSAYQTVYYKVMLNSV